ncbi:hypothetical protein L6164_018039 [Bauhinia variegata]|uniref:Uncharacterized protein n=1 Tax=Bauhinia variegata TaxID=167791 RepID=A0ACB9NA09_BAUVA|nr:hypothetical protein L6164_018039 [Bauhinia variegata]
MDIIMEKERQTVRHFSHRHALQPCQVKEEDLIFCSCCEVEITVPAYECTKPKCGFHLHQLCFELPKQVRLESHPRHPLTLLPSSPYQNGEFFCNGCGDFGSGFTYHCSVCQFDLHVGCASCPESLKLEQHQHPLMLNTVFPSKKENCAIFLCGLCNRSVEENCWIYYCQACDYGTHLDCAIREEDQEDNPEEIVF